MMLYLLFIYVVTAPPRIKKRRKSFPIIPYIRCG